MQTIINEQIKTCSQSNGTDDLTKEGLYGVQNYERHSKLYLKAAVAALKSAEFECLIDKINQGRSWMEIY